MEGDGGPTRLVGQGGCGRGFGFQIYVHGTKTLPEDLDPKSLVVVVVEDPRTAVALCDSGVGSG